LAFRVGDVPYCLEDCDRDAGLRPRCLNPADEQSERMRRRDLVFRIHQEAGLPLDEATLSKKVIN
jgi:hypothetical protein